MGRQLTARVFHRRTVAIPFHCSELLANFNRSCKTQLIMAEPTKKKQKWEEFIDFGQPPRTTAARSPVANATPTGPQVRVIRPIQIPKQNDQLGYYVNCTSSADDWATKKDLSPFYLGPCKLYGNHVSLTMENAWQFSKVFAAHVGKDGNPSSDYFYWAAEGWSLERAERYPMGKGAKPEFHWWDGRKLTRVEARKEIYVPLYAEGVLKTRRFRTLRSAWHGFEHNGAGTIYLMDFDAYDYTGMTLTQVLNNPDKSMGHGFVLAMLLTEDPALEECRMRPAAK